MSWLSDLANKAENFLNTLDSSAAEVLKSTDEHYYPGSDDHSDVVNKYDLPITIKPIEMLNITALQSVEEGSQCSTVNFTTRNNCSLDISRLNNEVYGNLENKIKVARKQLLWKRN
ncbi:unnamed protein product [Heterobilharzia americana]|nr:unnamed protein product [Heterobilharzia americana]